MEHSYWLGRKRASVANARIAGCAVSRLVHLDLAGRYSILAARARSAAPARAALGLQAPAADGAYYQRLETGARWEASRAVSEAERSEHLGMANRYARLRLDAAENARN